MKPQRYDILQAAEQIAASKTTYKKLVEITKLVEFENSIYGEPYMAHRLEGTGEFELREVTRAEYYA